jgi:hypothetical protein
MTTPQSLLYSIDYKLSSVLKLVEGEYYGEEEEEKNRKGIYQLCKAIEIESSQFNGRLERLEDKMDIIIKLLAK